MVAYSTNYYKFFVDGCQRDFVRTERHWYDVTRCYPLTDGSLRDAVKVSDLDVAELVAKSARAKVRKSRIRRFQKEVV